MNQRLSLKLAGFTVIALSVGLAHASERGGTSYPMGAETYMGGVLPPPGVYGQLFVSHYEADTFRGNDGQKLPMDFDLRVDCVAPRLIWVTEQKVLGGDLALHIIVPMVDLKVSVNGQEQSNSGLGDILFAPALGYHYSEKLHAIFAVDTIAPTGKYNRNDLANPGRNYWVFQPLVALSYVDPEGLNVDLKTMYDFNRKNEATDYLSGQALHMDYAVGWGLGNGWVVGVGGYALWQTTDDRQNGQTVEDNKARSLAIGPAIKYASNKGWFLTAKWQDETQVRNRPDGNAYWLKLTIPF
ncbi:SphA family protein [Pseudomonas akapageensis]|uniref:SphA family protein n=1 Tax=Pseudomonas akapageensis TaxID=2609961 RepID=UPI00140825A0|nr:transporter [Pseudomonas akapageensis]